jgi:hypothetical protein
MEEEKQQNNNPQEEPKIEELKVEEPKVETPETTNKIVVMSPEAIKYKMIAYVMIAILSCILIFGGAIAFYAWTHKDIIFTSQDKIKTEQGVGKVVNKAGYDASKSQVTNMTKYFNDVFDGKLKPNYTVETNGSYLNDTVKFEAQKNNSNVTVVVDHNNPDKKPTVNPNDHVIINEFNKKIFPGHEIGTTVYLNQTAVSLDYTQKVGDWYVGPSVFFNIVDPNVKVGVRVGMTDLFNTDIPSEKKQQPKGNSFIDVIKEKIGKKTNEPPKEVTLDQINTQLYPKNELGVTYYFDHSVAVDYQKDIKVFNKMFYGGPAVMYDSKEKDLKIGVRLSTSF